MSAKALITRRTALRGLLVATGAAIGVPVVCEPPIDRRKRHHANLPRPSWPALRIPGHTCHFPTRMS